MTISRRDKNSAETPPSIGPADLIERRPLANLIPYARNARTHSSAQIKAIAGSIREWGWTMPALVDEEGNLIAGHGRIQAAELLGLAEAPVMVARGWSQAKIRAYRLADNKLALMAGWDEELLGLELADLREVWADLALTGFEAGEIESLINGSPVPDEFGEYDETIATEHKCPNVVSLGPEAEAMTKLLLEIELDYDADLMHGDDPEAVSWFQEILNGELILHSNEIGDEIGTVTVRRVTKRR